MTDNDIKQLDVLIKKNLKGVATKQNFSSVKSQLTDTESRMTKRIDSLESRLRAEMATKKDLTSVEARLRREMTTKEDLKELRAEMATKRDLEIFEAKLRREVATKTDLEQLRQTMATKTDLADLKQELKNGIEDAVVQISTTIDKTISPLAHRVERIEEHLELSPEGVR